MHFFQCFKVFRKRSAVGGKAFNRSVEKNDGRVFAQGNAVFFAENCSAARCNDFSVLFGNGFDNSGFTVSEFRFAVFFKYFGNRFAAFFNKRVGVNGFSAEILREQTCES